VPWSCSAATHSPGGRHVPRSRCRHCLDRLVHPGASRATGSRATGSRATGSRATGSRATGSRAAPGAWHACTTPSVLTDNGSACRSIVFAKVLARSCTSGRGRAGPRPTRKVERYSHTLEQDCAYSRPAAARPSVSPRCPNSCTANHRGHTAIKGHSPASRVPNVRGENT
jgi:hypothetical protein